MQGLLLAAVAAVALEPIPDKLVVLTFDDASKSHAAVAGPLLKKYGFGATFFVTEGFDFPKNKKDYMTWEEIAGLHRDGFEIGNHTRDHKPPSAKNRAETIEQLEAINKRCAEHGIPKPVSFAYPGNALDRDVLPLLAEMGIKWARRGGAPEYPYDKGKGFAYEPGLDHPLLIPSAGDGRPTWSLDDFKAAVAQARGGKIAVIQLHGVPDTAHSWVNTPTPLFESYLKYLADNKFKVIALRDLARYVDPTVAPSNPFGVIEDRQKQLKGKGPISNARPARNAADFGLWAARSREFGFTPAETASVFGLTEEKFAEKLAETPIPTFDRPRDRLFVLPYPGGRHPRVGFLDGAIRPQRETKLGIFPPWASGGYAVIDVPEAVWHAPGGKRSLLYLAHTHVPTIWDQAGTELPPLEWESKEDGSYVVERAFSNKVVMTTTARPEKEGVRLEFRVRNGSAETLTGLDVQMCVMLKGLTGFEARTNDNKTFASPFSAASDATGKRWIVTGWEGCRRAWGNPPCPCVHSDPKLPDIPPGETKSARGWVSFHEGEEIASVLKRLERTAFP